MNWMLTISLAVFMSLAAPAATPQDHPDAPAADAGTPGAKLREDLIRAVKNANLTAEQRDTLLAARTRLRQAAEAKQNGLPVDRDSVRISLSDIDNIAKSGAFQPDDAKAVRADLKAMQQAARDSRPGRFRRNP